MFERPRVHPRRDHRVVELLSPSVDDHADRVPRGDGLQHRGSELIGTSAALRKVSGKTTVNPTPMTASGERAMRPSQVPIQIMDDDSSSSSTNMSGCTVTSSSFSGSCSMWAI